MKRVSGLLAAVMSLAFATAAFAQQPAEGVVLRQQRVIQGPEGGPPPPDANILFVATESFGGKTVKGAPYSAESVTETIQTLADGNRIINRITSTLYRDSEGRTRREQTLKGLGILGGGEEPLTTIFINDPVAGVTYSLDTRSHTAHKSMAFRFEMGRKAGVEGQQFEFKVTPGTAVTGGTARSIILTAPVGAPPPAGTPLPPPNVDHFTMRTEGGAAGTYVFKTAPGAKEGVQEQLGKQMIEGVEAEGTRTTITIPAGEIGNERPIEIITERWYSPELQVTVMSRHSDPRTGETTYKLTNIDRAEPAKSLFEVPAGYTLTDGTQFGPTFLPRTRKPTPEE
ncbi:MAG TPA: hypothetical protein VJ306_09305 [Pyrinomonadaceae bacterium]|jgi:hypothetical protein|nr:hypothetical protein [Pyrinomonadaceae bacterium]